ncbi:unnamed protein product [Peronospora effusa]|nr:unnamed protein product [Peronospora effusa]
MSSSGSDPSSSDPPSADPPTEEPTSVAPAPSITPGSNPSSADPPSADPPSEEPTSTAVAPSVASPCREASLADPPGPVCSPLSAAETVVVHSSPVSTALPLAETADAPVTPIPMVDRPSSVPVNVRAALRELQALADAHSRRIEDCEGRLGVLPPSAALLATRCERLEEALRDKSRLVAQLRESLQRETALVDRLRWKVDHIRSRYSLLAAELDHVDFSDGPPLGPATPSAASPPAACSPSRPAKALGKRSRRPSPRVPAKASRLSKPDASAIPPSAVSGGRSPVVLESSDDDLSDDSETLRAALAKSRSASRRPASANPVRLPSTSTPPLRTTSATGLSLKRAMFGTSDSETESSAEKNKSAPPVADNTSPLLADSSLLPRDAMIPGYMQTKTFSAAEVAPWPVDLVNSWCIVTMSSTDLVDQLDLPWGWFGPPDGNLDRPPKWKRSLMNPPMIQRLLAAEPWVEARVPMQPVSFRPVGWFAQLAAAYIQFDEEHSQALWEATHCLWISKDQARANSFLASYYNARKKRRSRATRAWREVVDLIFIGMSRGHCDLDIFLDPFFRHLPRTRRVVYWFPGREEGSDPVDLLEALRVSDSAWPWLTQYRLSSVPHPGALVPRLKGKFVPSV